MKTNNNNNNTFNFKSNIINLKIYELNRVPSFIASLFYKCKNFDPTLNSEYNALIVFVSFLVITILMAINWFSIPLADGINWDIVNPIDTKNDSSRLLNSTSLLLFLRKIDNKYPLLKYPFIFIIMFTLVETEDVTEFVANDVWRKDREDAGYSLVEVESPRANAEDFDPIYDFCC